MTLTTESVVAILRSAGLVAERSSRRELRAGFCVSQVSRREIGVTSNTMTATQWLTAMEALIAAGLRVTYRHDAGMGARVAAP